MLTLIPPSFICKSSVRILRIMSKDTVNIKLIWTDEQKNPQKNKISEMTI